MIRKKLTAQQCYILAVFIHNLGYTCSSFGSSEWMALAVNMRTSGVLFWLILSNIFDDVFPVDERIIVSVIFDFSFSSVTKLTLPLSWNPFNSFLSNTAMLAHGLFSNFPVICVWKNQVNKLHPLNNKMMFAGKCYISHLGPQNQQQ